MGSLCLACFGQLSPAIRVGGCWARGLRYAPARESATLTGRALKAPLSQHLERACS